MPKTHDVNGRPYLHEKEVSAGFIIEVDGGFTCMKEEDMKLVMENQHGKYVLCDEGQHYLDGQLDDGEHLIGMYHPKTAGCTT